jgi:ERCC4-type nuclease
MIIVDRGEVIAFENSLKRKRGKQYDLMLDNLKEIKKIAKIEDIGVDYIVYGEKGGYVFERKTFSDLLSSLFSGRLWKQLEGVKEVAEQLGSELGLDVKPGLIVEGNEFVFMKIMKSKGMKKSGFSEEMWYGIQIGLANLGIVVFRTYSLKGTIKFLKRLDEKLGETRSKVVVARRKELNDVDDERLAMLMGVNGVGGVKAKKLLEKFGSVRDVVNASQSELVSVLGKKVGSHFYEVVNSRG